MKKMRTKRTNKRPKPKPRYQDSLLLTRAMQEICMEAGTDESYTLKHLVRLRLMFKNETIKGLNEQHFQAKRNFDGYAKVELIDSPCPGENGERRFTVRFDSGFQKNVSFGWIYVRLHLLPTEGDRDAAN